MCPESDTLRLIATMLVDSRKLLKCLNIWDDEIERVAPNRAESESNLPRFFINLFDFNAVVIDCDRIHG